MTARIFLNGEWLAAGDARVSVMDRGFLFGDGVYEVIPVYSRNPSASNSIWRACNKASTASSWPIRIAATSGSASSRNWRRKPSGKTSRSTSRLRAARWRCATTPSRKRCGPTSVILAEPMLTPPDSQREQGIAAVSAADIRWLRCDLKATSLLANCLLRQMAVAAGCVETVLFRDGFLTEGSASSIFVIKMACCWRRSRTT
jgi:D-alanine transaminase